MTITACILTLNEERRLATCMRSLDWVDHVVVVDAGSEDGTVELARALGAEVHVHEQIDFATQRNHALGLIKSEWVLWADADWIFEPAFEHEARAAVAGDKHAGFEVAIKNVFVGGWLRHGGLFPEHRVRLHRRDGAVWSGRVHEQLALPGSVGRLKTPIAHHFADNLEERVGKTVRYARYLADDMRARGYRFRFRDLLWYPLRRALGKLFIRRGALDGVPGFVFWSLRGLETFLALAFVWADERKEVGR